MAESDQYHDEFQLADLDGLDNPTEASAEKAEAVPVRSKKSLLESLNTKRNAIIVLASLIFLIVVYKFFSGKTSNQKKESIAISTTANSSQPPVVTMPIAQPQPIALTETRPVTTNVDSKVTQKLSALELSQQSMRDDMTSLNTQLSGINGNMNEIMTKLSELSKVISSLNAVTEAQSKEIERLVARNAKKHMPPPQMKVIGTQYYIQAVIPGRAWLLATNGSSITVRVGSAVPGYGVVRMIDAVQGRVTTSSGHMIRFSQADS